jgi:propanol-preferring alcohol dehydrogenase
MAKGARVHVMARAPEARALALELGATSAGGADESPPEPLDAAILFTPVGSLVHPALEAQDRGGVLAIAGIHLSDIPTLDYQRHHFELRSRCSVTANTRQDDGAFLQAGARAGPTSPVVTVGPPRRADRCRSTCDVVIAEPWPGATPGVRAVHYGFSGVTARSGGDQGC